MRRGQVLLLIASLALALSIAPARADNSVASNIVVARGSGLACFSIKPMEGSATNCDALCADKGAACTATTSIQNPPVSCADKIDDPHATRCRCCAVER